MATNKKLPNIGLLFSSDSSDDEFIRRKPMLKSSTKQQSQTSASENEAKKIRLRVNISDSELTKSKPSIEHNLPDGYVPLDKSRVCTLRYNTLIQYETNAGKFIKKYFKKNDNIAGNIIVGCYLNNKRNYPVALNNIKTICVSQNSKHGGTEDPLKDTIEIAKNEWKDLRRDMVISYEKDNHEYVYKAKFNSFAKGPDGSSRFSLTTEQGYPYKANPEKINKIFRHITSNDKTLTYILEYLKKLDARIQIIEKKLSKH